jgi:hypothetical protein
MGCGEAEIKREKSRLQKYCLRRDIEIVVKKEAEKSRRGRVKITAA